MCAITTPQGYPSSRNGQEDMQHGAQLSQYELSVINLAQTLQQEYPSCRQKHNEVALSAEAKLHSVKMRSVQKCNQ